MRNNLRRTKASMLAASRRKLNAGAKLANGYSKYYRFVPINEIDNDSDASEIWGSAAEFRNEIADHYRDVGSFIGVAIAKPEYYDVLSDEGAEYSEVLSDGTLVQCMGGDGATAGHWGNPLSISDIRDIVGDDSLNSRRRTNCSRNRRLNAGASLAKGYSKYYRFVPINEIDNDSDASEIWGSAADFRNDIVKPYSDIGKFIGVAIAKPEYYDALSDDGAEYSEVLSDGSLVQCMGDNGGSSGHWGNPLSISDIRDIVGEDEDSMNSRRRTNCSRNRNKRRTLGLNSAKQIDAEWFYTLSDMETVVQAVLEQLDKDEGASIVLEGTDTGITLMVTSSEGEESSVPVDLNIEGDELADSEEPIGETEEY